MTQSPLGSPLLQAGDTGAPLVEMQRNLFTGQTGDSRGARDKMKCKHSPLRFSRWSLEGVKKPRHIVKPVKCYCIILLLAAPVTTVNNRGGHIAPYRIRAAFLSLFYSAPKTHIMGPI